MKRIKNPTYSSKPTYPKASETQKLSSKEAARALADGFSWALSAEGADFWGSVYERLNQIAADGVLKE